MQDAVIRPYGLDDFESLLKLLLLNIPEYFSPVEYPDFQKYLEELIEDYFVVVMSGTIVGCGGINYKVEERIAMISWDIVHPDYQGKGIGHRLLRHRIDLIKKQYPKFEIIVRTSQLAYQFYEKNGFKLLEKHKDYWPEGFDMYKMTYLL